jgi:hypothetical protein
MMLRAGQFVLAVLAQFLFDRNPPTFCRPAFTLLPIVTCCHLLKLLAQIKTEWRSS